MVFPPSPPTPNFYPFFLPPQLHFYCFLYTNTTNSVVIPSPQLHFHCFLYTNATTVVFTSPTPPLSHHISIFSSATVTYTFLLFSLYQHQHHHISVVSPPPAPSDFYCFPTTTTITASFPFFPSRHQHHVSKIRRICMRNTILAIQSLLIGSKYNSLKILKFLNCPQILPLRL